jgi:RNA polymerase sigma-70 factor (ECF subfamily)
MDEDQALERKHIEDTKTDPSCFEPLYKRYYPYVLKFIYKRMENLEDARDVAAIVFTKALQNIGKYKSQGHPFSAWLLRIAFNEINQFYRDSGKMRTVSLDHSSARNLADENKLPWNENLAVLSKAIQYLDQEDVYLVELRYFEERPFSELAAILGITENNAKVKTYRMLDRLKQIFIQIS